MYFENHASGGMPVKYIPKHIKEPRLDFEIHEPFQHINYDILFHHNQLHSAVVYHRYHQVCWVSRNDINASPGITTIMFRVSPWYDYTIYCPCWLDLFYNLFHGVAGFLIPAHNPG